MCQIEIDTRVAGIGLQSDSERLGPGNQIFARPLLMFRQLCLKKVLNQGAIAGMMGHKLENCYDYRIHSMSPEASLIVSCCRQFLGTQSSQRLSDAVRGINWDTAISLADVHSVMPILYSTLKQEGQIEVPEALYACFQANIWNNLTLAGELLRLINLLEAQGVAAIPLKGPMLAVQVYGDLGLRAFADLDLLVRPEDVPRTRDILLNSGYRINWTLPSSAESAWLRIKERQLSFSQSHGSVLVDLHWGLLPDYCSGASGLEAVWSRRQNVGLGGQSVPVLSPEDLLVYLCAHGGKHLWKRLGWVCDIAALLESRPNMNWSLALATATRYGSRRVILVGFRLVNVLFGIQLPDEVLRVIRADPVVESLARDIHARLFADPPNRQSPLEACRLNMRMIDGIVNKIRYFAGIVITPGGAEWRALPLPSWLYPVYYPFRMARIAAKYAWFGRR
jgi:Uncharacterised nucleotidyltransferase